MKNKKSKYEKAIESVISKCKSDVVARENKNTILWTVKEIKCAWDFFCARPEDEQDLCGSEWIPSLSCCMSYQLIGRLVDAYKGDGYQCEYTSVAEAEEDILLRARVFGLVPIMYHVETAETADDVVATYYYVDFAYLFNAED